LESAVWGRHTAVVELLLVKGDYSMGSLQSALDFARKKRDRWMVEALERRKRLESRKGRGSWKKIFK
jgi:hypothetical protein